MRKNSRIAWDSYTTDFRVISILTLIALVIGLGIDVFSPDLYQNSRTINIITGIFAILSLVLIFSGKYSLSFCFSIAAYSLLLNILFSYFLIDSEAKRILHFNRDTVFVAFIITLTAYFVDKYHAFITTGIYVISSIIYLIINKSELLENSGPTMFSLVAYSFIIFYFVRMQENSLKVLHNTNNKVNQQNAELLQRQEEITTQRDVLSRQKKLIESRNTEIMESLRFAKNIQESVLSKETDLERYFKKCFVISKAKAVISGDFFWVKEWKGYLYLSVVDCTGHGIPGALVSMLTNTYLGRAFIELDNPEPACILSYINNAIATELSLVDSFHARVGMDIACLRINFEKMEMEYSAAFSPLYRIRRDNLSQYEPSKLIIGSLSPNDAAGFKNETIPILHGDRFYLFSDGITDQFGGKLDKKYGYKRFRNALIDTNHKSMETQKQLFWKKWTDWKTDFTQVDDILLLGFEI